MSRTRRAAIATATGLAAAANAQQQFIDWVGPATGNWNNGLNWQGFNVPNVAGEVPMLIGHIRVTLDAHVLVDKIGMDHPQATIAINNGQLLGIQTMTDGLGNTGLFGGGRYEINGTAHGTYIRLYGPADSWAIFGSILEPDPSIMVLSSSGTATVDSTTANAMLYNEGRIEGAGSLGANSLRIRNNGVIAATHPVSLTLDAPSGGNTNTGDMRADGGVLTLLNGNFDNTGGTITVSSLPGSRIDVSGAVVTGGQFRSEPGATGVARGLNNSQFHACAFNGALEIPNGHLIFLSNDTAIGPDGVLRLAATAHGTYIRTLNNLTLSGAGGIRSSNTQNNVIDANAANLVLTNNLTGGIAGSMQLGGNSLVVVNNTLVSAEGSAGMTIDPPANGFVNNGALWARGGSSLLLLNGAFTNPGSINVEPGAVCNINASTILGGTFNTTGDGVIHGVNSTTLVDVSVSAGSWFNLPNGNTTHVQGTITNAGTMTLSGVGHGTYLRTTSNVTLNGPGQINASNTQNNVIDASVVNHVLTNNSTIRGSMQLGGNSLLVVNNGLVEALGSVGMTIDPPSGGFVNHGHLRAAPASPLTLLNGGFDNSDGEIESSSTITISGSTILGGVLRSVGGVFSSGANSTLQSITLDGTLSVPNGNLTYLSTAITNNGSMQLNGSAHGTYFRLSTPEVTLSGSGEIMCSNVQNNVIDATAVGHKLINNQSIRGSLQLCQNSVHLVNNGLVEAIGSSGLTIDPPATHPVDNNGTIRAGAGSPLSIVSGPVDNADGLLESLSTMTFNAASISGGTLRSSGGTFSSQSNSVLNSVLVEGAVAVPNGNLTYLQGAITNHGDMQLNASAHGTYFRTSGNVTISGTGTISCSNLQNNVIDANAVNEVLTLEGVTLRGSCQLGQNSLGIINRGTILASASAGMTIDPPGGAIGFTNDVGGTLAATGGNIAINAGNFTNAGTLRVDSGRLINRASSGITQTGGLTLVNGELRALSGTFRVEGGTLAGNGLVNAHVFNLAGTLSPGSPDAPTATLTIPHTYVQSFNAAMDVDLRGHAPGEWDRVNVTFSTSLHGTLNVRFIDGFTPAVGSTFRILNASSRTGTFPTVTATGAPGLGAEVIYDATGATIVITQVCGTSDFNGDGDIGTDQDIEAFFACLGGNCCDTCFSGGADFNMDGDTGTDQDIESFFRVLGGGPC